jgi:hemerythrin superfamily protein
MVIIKELGPMDIIKYRNVFNQINTIYGSFDGVYYKIIAKDKEYILHRIDNTFTLFDIETGKYNFFTIDEEYNIQGLIIDNMSFRYLDGSLIAKNMKTGITENVSLIKRSNGEDVDGYNGLAIHVQYDSKRDLRIIYTYQHMYNPDERIYDMHLENPFTVVIERNASVADNGDAKPQTDTYIKGDFDLQDEPISFSLATIKDYGLIPFLQKGNYSLQRKDRIVRYYKTLGQHKDHSAITLFPLCKQYRIEDINEKIKELGFDIQVSEILLDVYNRDDDTLKLFVDIVKNLKTIEIDNDNKSFGYKIAE